jgi:hypothetical protein
VALIDQRILIDASPQVIWDLISDPDKLTRWHTGYAGVSVLTTQRTGAGTRRRCALAGGGKDVIEEITAWMDGLGYEYRLIEGGPYRAMQGRLRLQAVPDGISVQWTISYQPKGLLGLLRDYLGGHRRVAQMMADSLRQLRRQVEAQGVRMTEEQRAKAGIQDRLDANARAQYQRRFAPPPGLESPDQPDAVMPAVDLSPTLEESSQATPPPVPEVPAAPVPSFVAELEIEIGEPDFDPEADTRPRAPEGLREALVEQASVESRPIIDPIRPGERTLVGTEIRAQTAGVVPPPPERITPPEPAAPVVLPSAASPSPAAPPAAPEPTHQRVTPARGIPSVVPTPRAPVADDNADVKRPPQTPKTDSGEISIWEVFGVKRPSEQDNEVLQDLFRSVSPSRKKITRRRVVPRLHQRRRRTRPVETVVGLRVWLALRAARIRLHHSLYADQD